MSPFSAGIPIRRPYIIMSRDQNATYESGGFECVMSRQRCTYVVDALLRLHRRLRPAQYLDDALLGGDVVLLHAAHSHRRVTCETQRLATTLLPLSLHHVLLNGVSLRIVTQPVGCGGLAKHELLCSDNAVPFGK